MRRNSFNRGAHGGRCAAGLILRWFSLRENSAVMLGGRSRRETRYALARYAQTVAASMSRRALRAPTLTPALLATAEIAPPHTARREPRTWARHWGRSNTASAKLRPAGQLCREVQRAKKPEPQGT